jgi:cytochrome P450
MQQLPPGPRFSLLEAYRFYFKNPYGYHLDCARAYGDPFTVPTVYGPTVVTGTPEGLRTIMSADPDTFGAYPKDLIGPLAGETSLLVVSGERHRRDRSLLMGPFHGERMRAYGSLIAEITEREARRLRPGERFEARALMQQISLQAIVRVLFGADDPRAEEIRDAALALIAAANPAILVFTFLRHELHGVGPWARFSRASRRLDGLLHAAIDARRARPEAIDDGGEDILRMLVDARYDDGSPMTDDDIRCQLVTLMLAGYETTATSLAWAFYWLHRHEDALERLTLEVDGAGPGALARLPYLDAVCNEVLRLCPPAPEALRPLRKPFRLEGWDLPAGVTVSMSIVLAHQREDLYPDPQRFRPERFLERTFAPHELLPFGGGARRCPGAALALYEMKIVLGTLLRARRFRLLERGVRAAFQNLTVGPSDGVQMAYEGLRRSSTASGRRVDAAA